MWTAVVQAIGQANQAKAQGRISAAESKTQALLAKMNANNTSLALERRYNEAMGNDAVIAGSQMRRGGSVTAIANAGKEALNWDLAVAKLNGDLGYMNRMNEASSFKSAGDIGYASNLASAGVSLFDTYKENSQLSAKAANTTEKKSNDNIGGIN